MLGVGCGGLWLALASVGSSQQAPLEGEEAFRYLAASFEANLARFSDITFEYEIEEDFGGLRRNDPALTEEMTHRVGTVSYAMKGSMYRIEFSAPMTRGGIVYPDEPPFHRASRYNDERFFEWLDNQPSYRVGTERMYGIIRPSPYSFVLYSPQLFEHGEVVEARLSQSEPVLVVQRTMLGSAGVFRFDLDPEKDFLPKGMTVIVEGRYSTRVSEIEWARTEEGLWYPLSAKREIFMADGELSRLEFFRMLSVETDTNLTEEDFAFEIGPNTRLVDADLGIVIDPKRMTDMKQLEQALLEEENLANETESVESTDAETTALGAVPKTDLPGEARTGPTVETQGDKSSWLPWAGIGIAGVGLALIVLRRARRRS